MNRNKLDVLFLIPHPFYQDRGSPIADEMVLRVLSERGNEVDVVTYSEGKTSVMTISIYIEQLICRGSTMLVPDSRGKKTYIRFFDVNRSDSLRF